MAKLGQFKVNEMDVEQVSEAVKSHLLQQKAKSMKGNTCVYKGGNGLCCAAGIFIQDYEGVMEGKPWEVVVEDYEQGDRHKDFISHLQVIHDSGEVEWWEEYFNSPKYEDNLHRAKAEDVSWLIDSKSKK